MYIIKNRYSFKSYKNDNFLFLGELIFLNEATFLDNLKTRYYKDKIYVKF